MITLTLRNFRCYPYFKQCFESTKVVLTGRNGAGKTSLLEALSLFSPGKGLRNANTSSFQSQDTPSPWCVSLLLEEEDGVLSFQTTPAGGTRKVFHYEEMLSSQMQLLNWMNITWIPGAWQELSTYKRAFFNRLCFIFCPNYGSQWLQYQKLLKQRQLLFLQGEVRNRWYESIEYLLADIGVSLFSQQQYTLRTLQGLMAENCTPFPVPTLETKGLVETLFKEKEVEASLYIEALATYRKRDALRKKTLFGVHATDFSLYHPSKRSIALCSAGEQKGMLLCLSIAISKWLHRIHPHKRQFFLLDEPMAHLDHKHQDWLWQTLKTLPFHVWMTGMDTLKVPDTFSSYSL